MPDLDIPNWDSYFMEFAKQAASRSKDPNTKVGAVIVGPNYDIRSTGFNGFARGVYEQGSAIHGSVKKDGDVTGLQVVDFSERWERPEKYDWVIHGELNAILHAARNGVSCENCVLYVTHPPCMSCCAAAIQAGISCIVVGEGTFDTSVQYARFDDRTRDMLREADVRLVQWKPEGLI